MKIFTKILFFILFLSACASSRYGGMTSQEVYRINHRAELQKRQRDRQARARKDKKAAEKETKQKEKEEKAQQRALKKGAERHLDWQSPETRERIKENKKESEKNFTN
ncbi:MAG: hypothetical protein LBF19_04820 [Prevotellaceae bacterium]|nr:hypothetical protein [Prevotellaceae bacterium]